MNNSRLVHELRERNPAAVQYLCDSILPSVWRFVYARIGRDHHLAEDIVSESVLALIRAAADESSEISNAAGWLRTVASNKVNDHYRAAARVQHLVEEVERNSDLGNENDPVAQQELKEKHASIQVALDALPEQQRLALEWKYIEKRSVREIAELMQLTEKAAESVLYRARRDFRERLLRSEPRDVSKASRSDGGTACAENGCDGSESCGCHIKQVEISEPTRDGGGANDKPPSGQIGFPVNTGNDTAAPS